jgi:peptidylprolyl isomerase
MGQRKVIPGLELALASMKQGGVRKVIVPAKLAYGDRGVCLPEKGCLVPPGETLEYDLTLKRVAISPI